MLLEWRDVATDRESARPLRRAIQRYIEDELSEFLIRHKDSVPEWIDFTMNANEVLLMPRSSEALTP